MKLATYSRRLLSLVLSVVAIDAYCQVVSFTTTGDNAATSISSTKNATSQASGVSGTPSLSRTGLTAVTGAANSFYSTWGSQTMADVTSFNALTNAHYVGFAVSASAGNALFVTGINWNSQGSNSAPNSYATAYSTDGFASAISTTFTGETATSSKSRSFNITDLITNDTLSVRLYNWGSTSINNGTPAASGTFRVIDPVVTGSTVSTSSGAVTLAAATEVRTASALSLGGNISGSFALTKTGSGALTLSGSNSHSSTTISAGTLTTGSNSALGSGTVTVNSGGTLNLGSGFTHSNAITVNSGGYLTGAGTASGTTTIASGGYISPGSSPGTLSNSGTLNLDSGSIYNWELASLTTSGAGTNFDQILNTGSIALNSGALINLVFGTNMSPDQGNAFWNSNQSWTVIANGGSGTITGSALSLNNSQVGWSSVGSFSTSIASNELVLNWTAASAVPEPSTYAALAGAAALVGVMVHRRRQRLAAKA